MQVKFSEENENALGSSNFQKHFLSDNQIVVTLCADIPRTQDFLEAHFQMAMLSWDHQLVLLQPKHIQLGKKTCAVPIVQALKLILKIADSGFQTRPLIAFFPCYKSG